MSVRLAATLAAAALAVTAAPAGATRCRVAYGREIGTPYGGVRVWFWSDEGVASGPARGNGVQAWTFATAPVGTSGESYATPGPGPVEDLTGIDLRAVLCR